MSALIISKKNALPTEACRLHTFRGRSTSAFAPAIVPTTPRRFGPRTVPRPWTNTNTCLVLRCSLTLLGCKIVQGLGALGLIATWSFDILRKMLEVLTALTQEVQVHTRAASRHDDDLCQRSSQSCTPRLAIEVQQITERDRAAGFDCPSTRHGLCRSHP